MDCITKTDVLKWPLMSHAQHLPSFHENVSEELVYRTQEQLLSDIYHYIPSDGSWEQQTAFSWLDENGYFSKENLVVGVLPDEEITNLDAFLVVRGTVNTIRNGVLRYVTDDDHSLRFDRFESAHILNEFSGDRSIIAQLLYDTCLRAAQKNSKIRSTEKEIRDLCERIYNGTLGEW